MMRQHLDSSKLQQSHHETTEVEWVISNFFSGNEYRRFGHCESPIFTFVQKKWSLELWHHSFFGLPYTMRLFLKNSEEVVQDVKFERTFGLKKADGTVEYFPEKYNGKEYYTIFDSNEVLHRRNELVPSNIMTIILKLATDEFVKQHSTCPPEVDPMKCIKLDALSDNFKSLFADTDSCDLTLNVKGAEFKAHKAVLMARCPVFASMFHHNMKENQTGMIKISDCDPKSFHQFLEYLYCGKLEDVSFPVILDLYTISDKYNVVELKTFCIEYMKHSMTIDNVCDIVKLADMYDETRLLAKAQDFFNKKANKVVLTTKWESLMKDNYCLANRLLIEMTSKMYI